MAAALKKSKKQGKSGAGVAIALVFFILLSIGLGVWGYYGYKGQHELVKIAKDKETEKEGAKIAEDYFRFLAWDYALALGYDLEPATKKRYMDLRKDYMALYDTPDGGGRFKVIAK